MSYISKKGRIKKSGECMYLICNNRCFCWPPAKYHMHIKHNAPNMHKKKISSNETQSLYVHEFAYVFFPLKSFNQFKEAADKNLDQHNDSCFPNLPPDPHNRDWEEPELGMSPFIPSPLFSIAQSSRDTRLISWTATQQRHSSGSVYLPQSLTGQLWLLPC